MMKKELKDILDKGLVTDLYKAERAIFVNKKIEENAIYINASESYSRQLFIYIQTLSFNEAVLALSRIYDTPDNRYPTRCLLQVIEILKDKNKEAPIVNQTFQTINLLKHHSFPEILIKDIESQNYGNFARRFGLVIESDYHDVKLQESIRDLRKIRDKVIAHNEAISKNILRQIPWSTFELLVDFAQKVIGLLGWAYFNTAFVHFDHYHLSSDAKQISSMLGKVLLKLNIIKK
ncbi:MAG: hypothetical protein FK734_20860 [Asgard group archaeon]|nr:hypothetical protein [Asgard group archaeon]